MIKLFLILILFFDISDVTGQTCEMLTSRTGTVTSPNYPGSYPNYVDVCWTIDFGVPVLITFHTVNTESCCDFLRFYDGDGSVGAPLMDYRGIMSPPDLLTVGTVSFEFHSDYSVTRQGFSLEYTVLFETTLATTEFTTVPITTEQTTLDFETTEPEMLPCDRQQLINAAPRMEILIRDATSFYLLSSSVMTHEGSDYVINNILDRLDVETDFPLIVHQTTVLSNNAIIQISGGRVSYEGGAIWPDAHIVSSHGDLVTGELQAIYTHRTSLGEDSNAFADVTFELTDTSLTIYEGDSELFPWFMPEYCFPEEITTTVAPDERYYWLEIYLGLGFGLLIVLAAVCFAIYLVKRKNKTRVEDEPCTPQEDKPRTTQRTQIEVTTTHS